MSSEVLAFNFEFSLGFVNKGPVIRACCLTALPYCLFDVVVAFVHSGQINGKNEQMNE